MNQVYNILFLFPLAFHPEKGGIERVTDILAKEFTKRGHRVFYLHKKGQDAGYGDYIPPASVCCLPEKKLASAANLTFYHRFLWENRIDIIVNQMGLSRNYCPFTRPPEDADWFPKSISVMHNPPMLNYEHLGIELLFSRKKNIFAYFRTLVRCLFFPVYKWSYGQKRRRELAEVARSSDCICLLSNAYRSELERAGCPPCCVRAIANPCSYSPAATPGNKKKQIIYVARLEPVQKAPQRLIPVWKLLSEKHPDWELVIVGDGPYRKTLEKKVASLPRIRLVGYQNPLPYFQQASICCQTSTFEGFPMVLGEAISQGVVPVAFNSFPTLAELLGKYTDKLAVTPFNTEEFAEKLSWLMSHEEERQQMAHYFLGVAAGYAIEAIADCWERLFGELWENDTES